MNALYLKLISLGLIEPNQKNSVIFTASQSNEWSIGRVVSGQPFWKHVLPIDQKELTFKTIIVNHSYSNYIEPPDEKIYEMLLALNFVLCLRLDENSYLKITNFDELRILLSAVKLAQPDKIISELINLHQPPEEYLILDDQLRSRLITELEIVDNFSTTTTFYLHPKISPENISTIAERLVTATSSFQYIATHGRVPKDENYQAYEVTLKWKNKFSKKSTQLLLHALQDGNDLETYLDNDNFYSIQVDCPEPEEDDKRKLFDLTPFQKAEHISLHTVEIENLEACQRLKSLEIYTIRCDIDLAHFPHMETLNIKYSNGKARITPPTTPTSIIPVIKYEDEAEQLSVATNGQVLSFHIIATVEGDFQTVVREWLKLNDRKSTLWQTMPLDFSQTTYAHLMSENEVVDFTGFAMLEHLILDGSNLTEIRGLGDCQKLKRLELFCSQPSLSKVLSGTSLPLLSQLVIYNAKAQDILSIPASVIELSLFDSTELTNLHLGHLPNLQTLNIVSCRNLRQVTYNQGVINLSIKKCPQLVLPVSLSQLKNVTLDNVKQVIITKNKSEPILETISITKTDFSSVDQHEQINPNVIDLQGQTCIRSLSIVSASPFRLLGEGVSYGAETLSNEYFVQYQNVDTVKLFPIKTSRHSKPIEYANNNLIKEDKLILDIHDFYAKNPTDDNNPPEAEDDFELDFLAEFFENPVSKKNATEGPRLNFGNAGKAEKTPVLRPQKVFDDDNLSRDIPTRDYRKNVYPWIYIDETGDITPRFSSKKTLTPVKNAHELDLANSIPGYDKIRLMPGEEHILTGLSASDALELDDKENFDLFINQDQQYVIKLKSHVPSFKGILTYHVKPDPNYMIPFDVTPKLNIFNTSQSFMPNAPQYKKLKDIVLNVLKDKFDLTIMTHGTQSQRFDQIVEFCRGFSEKDPCEDDENWQKLIDLISNQKGVCSHRSFVAKILCDFFKIPTRLIDNDEHMYLEVFTQDRKWHGIDLGGGDVELQVKPIKKPKANETASTKESKQEIDDPMNIEEEQNPYELEFLQDITWVLNAPSFKDFASNLLHNKGNPLLRTVSNDQIFKFYKAFASYAKEQSIDFLYIRDAIDLQNLFQPYKIDNGFHICDGPLVKLLKKGSGVILIDWNNFSPQERGTYKCLIDIPPTWDGKELPGNIKVIGFLDNNVTANDVFNSRTVKLPVPDKLLSNPPDPKITTVQPIRVNLYHSQDWMRLLVYDITFTNGQVHLTKGKLLEALEQGKPIEIINPPNDPAFEILRDRLMVEGKFMFNGEMLTAKTGFQLNVTREPIILEPPDDFAIQMNTPVPQTGKKYFINRGNFSSLFKSFHISDKGEINTNNGIFSQLTPGDQIILTETLEAADLAYLYNELSQLSPEQRKLINIYEPLPANLVPAICNTVNEIFNNDFNHIETNDPHFVSDQLQKMFGLPSENIFYTTGDNTWANLIETVDIKITDNGLEATRLISAFWQKLCAGETVTIVGDLSLEDQMLFESLFANPPYLFVNGERVQVDGKLIWVSKPQEKYTSLTKPQLNYQATIADYETALREELANGNDDEHRTSKRRKISIDDYAINKINDFFLYAKKLTANQRPGPGHFTYQKYREFYQKILSKPNQSNPVKSILTYHYEKNSDEYAYINVISKMLFSRTGVNVRLGALDKIMKNIHSEDDINRNIWRIINCFSGEYIYHHFLITLSNLSDEPLPKPNEETIRLVMKAVDHELQQNSEEIFKLDRANKQKKRLIEALYSPKQPLVCLFGEAGTGKTYSVHELEEKKQIRLFEGLEQIKAFANCKDANPKFKVLYLDEGNMLPAQRLEFLRGLMQNPPVLNIGESLPLTEDHKVFLSGNPLSYVGREFHEVLWDCANLIWYKPFQEDFIKAFVIASIQETCPSEQQAEIANIIAKFYHSMLGKNPDKTTDITLRDVENITAKLLLYKSQNRFSTWEECAKQAIYAEIHGTLINHEARNRLMKQLEIVPMAYQGMEIKDIVIPEEKMEMWQLIKDDLNLRTNGLTAEHAQPFKRGVLLEGASGIGKSTTMTTILDECGLSLHATDPQKRYYVLNAGEPNVRQILLKAFDEGSVVILNELNLDPDLEDLLNKLLDPNNKGKKPGFMVLATQNPSYYEGCKPLSKALVSRMHTVIMNEYSKPALEFIATKKKHPDPARLVKGFFDVRAKFPGIINTRNFFDVFRRSTKTKS